MTFYGEPTLRATGPDKWGRATFAWKRPLIKTWYELRDGRRVKMGMIMGWELV